MTPLSYGQQRLWLLDRFEGTGWTYHIAMRLEMRGDLDVPALEQALADLVERHETLRTAFPDDRGVPRQELLPAARVPLAVLDGRSAGLQTLVDRVVRQEFDLATEAPFRAVLIARGPAEHVLCMVMHHIAVDGWSMEPLLRDLAAAYSARAAGRAPGWDPLPVRFADFALWERDVLGSPDDPTSLLSEQLDYWSAALRGMPQEIALPTDRPRPATPSLRGGAVPVVVDADLHRTLAALARDSRATLFMVVHAAVAALLCRLGGGEDIPIGTGLAGRVDEALNDVVGFFVSTVVLRADLSGDPTFRELLGRTRDADLAAFDHQDVPFDRVVEALAPRREPGRHPLFQTMLAIQGDYRSRLDFAGLDVTAEKEGAIERQAAKFDLYLDLSETRDADGVPAGLHGELKYASALFDEPTVRLLAERLLRILRAMAADPGLRLSEAVLVPADEQARLAAGLGAEDTLPEAVARVLARQSRPGGRYRVRVLDGRLAPVPTGVSGRIHLSGGPFAGDAATVPDPYGTAPEELLDTGLQGRLRPGGGLELTADGGPFVPELLTGRPRGTTRGPSARPRTPRQEILCGLFADALRLDTVGIHDDFFELGGHSLLAARVVGRLRTDLGLALDLGAVFRAPTVARLDALIGQGAGRPAEAAPTAPRPEPMPLSPAQFGLWMVDQIEGPSASYNIPVAFRLTGPLRPDCLEAALNDVVRRHEALRTVFPQDGLGDPFQRILPPQRVRLDLHREHGTENGLADLLAALGAQVLDLADGPLFRAHLIELGPTDHALMLLVHHIVFDGRSLPPLLDDLGEAYAARLSGRAPDLPPPPAQYADCALRQLARLGDADHPDSLLATQLRYWRDALAGLPAESTVPGDRPRARAAGDPSGIVPVVLDLELHRGLLRTARQNGTTLFMALHAGWAAALALSGAGDDIAIGTPVDGRAGGDPDDAIGYLVNTLVLRTDVSGDPTYRDLLARVRATNLEAYARPDVPFDRLVQALNPPREAGRNPLFQVGLALEQGTVPTPRLPGVHAAALALHGASAKLDLDLTLAEQYDGERPAGLAGTLEYPTARYDRATVEAVAARFGALLALFADDADLRLRSAAAMLRREEMES
ncbi:condensation domain-containing protein [Kitasatospora terrestris]|uniref:Carrier domain-containing protein n=1 Tax=Kitasatospora terrestris TaxID=258051 RepID=A0ABP9DBW5_9ACTN